MGKDNVLEYPKLDNEVITVKNFMVIKEATMKCGDITVLVGEQATGKSLLAKLRYFFWNYQEILPYAIMVHSWHGLKGDGAKEHKEEQTKIFNELFPNIKNVKNEFALFFESGDISISIKKDKNDSEIKIEHSKGLKNFIKNVQDIANKNHHDGSITMSATELDFQSIPTVLYVPASRLFFATIEGNPFQFFDKKTYSFDFLLRKFGTFWVKQKKDFSKDFKDSKKSDAWFNNARTILAGDYVHKDETDYIKTTWGETVELKDASSGQQEVLPLLAAIKGFSTSSEKNQLLIIEEPEAHIYPTAQRALMKMIAEVARKKGCKVMIATHSPYIPACINNEIKIAENEDDFLDVTAYHVSDGTVEDVYYKKYNLINVNKLDEASTQIAKEYCEQIAKAKKRTKNKSENLG